MSMFIDGNISLQVVTRNGMGKGYIIVAPDLVDNSVPTFEYNSGVSPMVYLGALLVGMVGMCVAIGLGFAGKL